MTRDEVINTLRDYKRLIAIHESLINDYEGVLQAQTISDMPTGNSLSNPTEKAILKLDRGLEELKREIRRVQIWLNYLSEEERFIVEQIYIEERFINIASNKWCSMGREYHSNWYWKSKKKDAINKIIEILPKSYPN